MGMMKVKVIDTCECVIGAYFVWILEKQLNVFAYHSS